MEDGGVLGGGEGGGTGGEEEELAFGEAAAGGAFESALGDGEDGELSSVGVGDRFTRGEFFLVGFEILAGCEVVADGDVHGGFEIAEVDGGEGLCDVEFAGFAVEAGAVPIEDAVGGVRVLLDLVDEESCADGVEAAGGDEDGFAGFGSDGVHCVGDGTVGDGFFEVGAGDAIFEADVEFGTGVAVCDVPHFGFGFATEFVGEVDGRVDLDGEVVAGVEHFDEDGEAGGIREVGAEDFFAACRPEIVEGGAGEGAAIDDGLFAFAIDDFPGFAKGLGGIGELAVVNALEFASAPDAFHVEGFEGEWFHARGDRGLVGFLQSWRRYCG